MTDTVAGPDLAERPSENRATLLAELRGLAIAISGDG
jgi:hypothetical protein